jgi:hypothetical protein
MCAIKVGASAHVRALRLTFSRRDTRQFASAQQSVRLEELALADIGLPQRVGKERIASRDRDIWAVRDLEC